MRMTKRLTALLLSVTLLITMFVIGVAAETLTEGDFVYEINETGTGVIITNYTGTDKEVTVPDRIGELPVVAIGQAAFEAKTTITSISLPDTLTLISSNAFSTCIGLTSVTIPDSVVTIGSMAFYNCFNLNEIIIGPNTYDIGYQAFQNTKWLSEAEDGPLYLGRVLYTYIGTMPAETRIVVKNGTAAIAPYAFSGRKTLKSIYLPVGLRLIGSCAFLNCTMMTDIRIPPSVTDIETGVFLGAPATTISGVSGSAIDTYLKESGLVFEHDDTLDYPDGDLNFDKVVNTTDFRILMNYLLDPTQSVHTERLQSCDIIYNGIVNMVDLRYLILLHTTTPSDPIM